MRTRARVQSALPKPPLSLHSSNSDKEGETERDTRAAESTMTLPLKINQTESVPTRGHLCSPTKTQEKSSQWRSTVSMLMAVAALSCSGFGFVDATWLDGLSAATNKSTCKPSSVEVKGFDPSRFQPAPPPRPACTHPRPRSHPYPRLRPRLLPQPPYLPLHLPYISPNTAPLPSFEAATPNPNPTPNPNTLTLILSLISLRTLTLTLTKVATPIDQAMLPSICSSLLNGTRKDGSDADLLPYISPASRLLSPLDLPRYVPYTSPISPPYLPYISPISPLYLPRHAQGR